MNLIILFLSTFGLVFALNFQTLNVSRGQYVAAFLTSILLGVANLVILRAIPHGNGWEIVAYLSGGPFGVIASMWVHARYFNNEKPKGGEAMAHRCNANDCLARIDGRHLMCTKHWRMVPLELQRKVWETYRSRGTPAGNPAGWASYYEACADAIERVAGQEGKSPRNSFRNLAPKFRTMAEDRVRDPAGLSTLR